MKKITLLILMCFTSFLSHSQLTEGFEGTTLPVSGTWALGSGSWAVFDNGVGTTNTWNVNTGVTTPPLVYEGTRAAFMNGTQDNLGAGNTSQDWLVSPAITVPANGQLRFFTRQTLANDQGTIYQVRISTTSQTDASSFTVLQQWNETTLNATFNLYEEKVVALGLPEDATVYVAFVMVVTQPGAGVAADRWLVDSVKVVEQCLNPTNLGTDGVNLTTANLTWGNPSGATSWEIEIVTEDTATPSGHGVVYSGALPYPATGTATGSPLVQTPFVPDTEYKYYVRALCTGSGTTSDWVGPFSFSIADVGETCSSAIVIPAGTSYSTTDDTANYGDTVNGPPGESGCGSDFGYLNGNDVFYSYTATEDGVISISMTPTDTYSGLFVYNGCENVGVSCIAGVANSDTTIREIPALSVTAGETYIILISTWAAPQTTGYNLVIQEVNCTPPSDLSASNMDQTSAVLSWGNPGNLASAWEVVVQEAGDPIPTGSGSPATDNENYLASGLTVATAYQYYVRADCGDGTFSAWAGPYFFNTTICEPSAQCLYDFVMTDSYGDGWNGNTMDVRQNGITVATIGDTFTGGLGPVTVQVALCDGIPVELYWNEGGNFAGEVGVSIIDPFGETIYTKEPGDGEQDTSLFTNPVNCTPPTCPKPIEITVDEIGMNSVEVAWAEQGSATDWEIIIQDPALGFPAASATGVPADSNPFTLTDLLPGTNYEIYVRAVCATDDLSDWNGPVNFATTLCAPSDQCNYTFIMTDSFGDGWNGNTMNVLQNGVVLATIGSTFTDGEGPVTVDVALCDGVPFELYWNAGGNFAGEVGVQIVDAYEEDVYIKAFGDGDPDSSLFTGTVDCTPPSCPKPQDLEVVSLSLNGAVVNWTEMGSATSWELVVQEAGLGAPTVGTPSVIVTTAPPYTVGDLESGTAYEFYIRALCAADDLSNWSGPRQFATLIENDECATATIVPVNPDLECDEVASGILIGATASPEDNTCFGTADDDVWFEFVATSTTHLIGFSNFGGSGFPDLYHIVYEGDECGSLTQLYCGTGDNSTASDLIVGNTYKIRVYSWTDDPGQDTSFDICVRTPEPPIATDNTTYTVEQLVSEILIGSTCAQVTNITSSTGTDFGQDNGIAYFTQNGSSFPFTSGIVLTTGDAMRAPGPNAVTLSDGQMETWPGDPDLELAINDPDGFITHNATVIEFDFIPLTDQLSFDFIFASEEYDGGFQCDFDDAFAFLLTDSNGNTQNLAVLPNGGGLIAVTNIHPDVPFSCPAINEEYFDQYNDEVSGAINFNGQVVPLTAQATVVPNTQYHIKLVIADQRDSSWDSAIFLEEGSFNIGTVDLGTDLLVSEGNAVCGGEPFTIMSGLDPEDYEFTWTLNGGDPIAGETGPNLTVTESGTYGINALFIGSTCSAVAEVTIEFYDPIEVVTGDPIDLVACDADGFATFDLTENTDLILTGLDASNFTITYHLSQADADNNVGALPTTYENTVQYTQPIFVRIFNNTTECVGTKTFNLIVQDLTPQFTLTPNFSLCDGTSGTITVTPSNFNVADVTFAWTLGGSPLAETGSTITVTEGGFYEVFINNSGCTATDEVTVTIVPIPVADAPSDASACQSYVLPALTAGNSYYTGTGGTGTLLAAGSTVTSTQLIYVYAQSGTQPNCTDENSFTVTIVPAVQAIVDGGCQDNAYIMEALPVAESYDPSSVSYSWALASAPDTELGTGQSLTVSESGEYLVTITTASPESCTGTFGFTASGTACQIQKGISPNGDGKNDSFDLSGLQVRKISIFNRYGTEVYGYGSYTDQWHGQSDGGDELPDGTYYYMFERQGGESKTGWIYINRQRD